MNKTVLIGCAALVTALSTVPAYAATAYAATSSHATSVSCAKHKTTAIIASDEGALDSQPGVETFIWKNVGNSVVPSGTSWPLIVTISSSNKSVAAPALSFSDAGGTVSAKPFTKAVASSNPNDPRHRVTYTRTSIERFTLTHDIAPGETIRLNVTGANADGPANISGIVHGSSDVVTSTTNTCDTMTTRVTVAPSYLG